MTDHTQNYFREVAEVARGIDQAEVDRMIDVLVDARTRGGRLFILGVGGSAGNAGHAVNDFRKLCGIEAYAPTDNVSELTARVNDDGWATSFANWLRGSRIVNVDPAPSLLHTVIVPPCAAMTCLAMARPRPVPPVALDRAGSTR